MRISTHSRFNGIMPNMHRLLREQVRIQGQIASGKRILRPKDDPAGAAISVVHDAEAARASQHVSNITAADAWVRITDAAMGEAVSVFERASELAVAGADESKAPGDLAALAEEVDGLLEHLLALSETRYRGAAVFGGTKTEDSPFAASRDANGRITSVGFQGNGGPREIEVRRGVSLDIAVHGSDEAGGLGLPAFRDSTGYDAFQVLIDLRDHLAAGDASAAGTDVAEVGGARAQISTARTAYGTVQTRLDLARASQEEAELTARTALDETAAVDVSEAAVELAEYDAAYQAALAVGTRIMQISLLDYLG